MPDTDDAQPGTGAPGLTDREKTIVFLMGSGHSSPEIASMLGLSPRTVENRKRLIYEKLGVGSQGQAVAEAVRLGLLQSGGPGTLAPPVPWRPLSQGEPGRAMLAVLAGPASRARDRVASLLIAERVPLVIAQRREGIRRDHWLLWHRGHVVVVLVDPAPEDWRAASSLPAPAVVVSSSNVPAQRAIANAMARNAGGLVAEADAAANGLGPTLAAAAQGLLVMSWSYVETLRRWASAPGLAMTELTAREREILGLIARGHTVRQTARSLGISTKTVENIQTRLFRKLGARNRMEALTIADAWGLVEGAVLSAGLDRSAMAVVPAAPARPSFLTAPAGHRSDEEAAAARPAPGGPGPGGNLRVAAGQQVGGLRH